MEYPEIAEAIAEAVRINLRVKAELLIRPSGTEPKVRDRG